MLPQYMALSVCLFCFICFICPKNCRPFLSKSQLGNFYIEESDTLTQEQCISRFCPWQYCGMFSHGSPRFVASQILKKYTYTFSMMQFTLNCVQIKELLTICVCSVIYLIWVFDWMSKYQYISIHIQPRF